MFNPEEDAFEHQLSLRTVSFACIVRFTHGGIRHVRMQHVDITVNSHPQVSVDPTTKDELQVVEVEGCDANGQTVKTVLASVRPSCLPCVSCCLYLKGCYGVSISLLFLKCAFQLC